MFKRIPHKEESPFRLEDAKAYVKEHAKQQDFMYGPFLKDLRKYPVKGRCLEIGAGPGLFTRLFAEQYPDVTLTVTDISPIMISIAKQYICDNGLDERVEFTLCDAKDAAVLNRLGEFDFILSLYSLHHWQDPEACIRNLSAILKDGGMLYLGDLKRVWWLYYLPVRNRDIEEIRAAYRPGEVRKMIAGKCRIATLSPFFLQSIAVDSTACLN